MVQCELCGVETTIVSSKVLDYKVVSCPAVPNIQSTCLSCSFSVDLINKLYKRSESVGKALDEVLAEIEIARTNAADLVKFEGKVVINF